MQQKLLIEAISFLRPLRIQYSGRIIKLRIVIELQIAPIFGFFAPVNTPLMPFISKYIPEKYPLLFRTFLQFWDRFAYE